VDLDGVCADHYARMREAAAEWFERRIEDLTPDVSYGLREWGVETGEQYDSLHRFAVTQRDLFKTAPMIPGARKYLRKLSNAGDMGGKPAIRIRTKGRPDLGVTAYMYVCLLDTVDPRGPKGK
jgi:hypothetical protein